MTDPISNERLLPCPFCGSRVLNQFKDDDNHIIECAQCGCEIANTIAWKAIAAWNRRQSPVGVVKELGEWRRGYCDEQVTIEQVSTGFGSVYQVRVFEGRVWLDLPVQQKEEFPTIEAAKAAAQADYERRVLSSLSVKEPVGVEPVWFGVQSASGAHIGMWKDELIARRVFETEYPDGKFIPLYADPPPKAVIITDEMVERAAEAIAESWGEKWHCDCSENRGLDCDCGFTITDESEPYDERLSREDCRMASRAALTAALPSEAHNG